MKKVSICNLLPEDARDRLVAAARSGHYAVDAAINYVKHQYPELFVNEEKGEVENETKTRKCTAVIP